MRPERGKRRPGITTAETLIAIAIFSLLTTGVTSLFLSSARGWEAGSSKSESDTHGSLAVQKVVQEITNGKWATVDADGRLTVQLPAVNDQGVYDRAFDGDQMTYYVSDGDMYRQTNGGSAELFARGITSAVFTVASGMVTLSCTGQGESGQKTMQTEFSQKVLLRNYVAE